MVRDARGLAAGRRPAPPPAGADVENLRGLSPRRNLTTEPGRPVAPSASLLVRCVETIARNLPAVARADPAGMARITPEHLVAVLTHDALGDSVASEDDVWEHVREWCVGRRGDEVREVLPHVRFPTLTTETLEQCEEWAARVRMDADGVGALRELVAEARARRIPDIGLGLEYPEYEQADDEDDEDDEAGSAGSAAAAAAAAVGVTEVMEAMDDDDEDGSPGRRSAEEGVRLYPAWLACAFPRTAPPFASRRAQTRSARGAGLSATGGSARVSSNSRRRGARPGGDTAPCSPFSARETATACSGTSGGED